MWKQLPLDKTVRTGDRLRCTQPGKTAIDPTLFEVTKADRHYFEMSPLLEGTTAHPGQRRIVRYFDIGRYFVIDIWVEG